MRCVDADNDDDDDVEMEMKLKIDSFMQIYQSLSLRIEVEDAARLPCHKAFERKAWHFNLQADADRSSSAVSSRQQAAEVSGGRRQDTTSRKQHAADMQICKSRRVDNFQPNQICNCSSMFPSRLHARYPSPSFICPCHTNFVNLYLPRAAHTNNPRNRLEATMLPATSNYKKLL